MAKARDIAALAGLAGLAYAINKDKDKPVSSAYATRSNMTPIKGVGDATNDVATNKSAYATRSNMTPMQGVGDATNDPLVKPKPAPKPAVAADKPAGSTTPLSSANRTDQLTNLSRAVKREDKTKKAAQNESRIGTSRFESDNYTLATNARALSEKLNREAGAGASSAYKTDAMKVASRAAAAANARRRASMAGGMKNGGMTASSRADGCAVKGKTKGRFV